MKRIVLLAALVSVAAACSNIPGFGQQICPNRWFDEADKDRSRTVTRAEYEAWAATCTNCEAYAGWFTTADPDGDGVATMQETCSIRGVPRASASPSP
jgi:hypothetical protein